MSRIKLYKKQILDAIRIFVAAVVLLIIVSGCAENTVSTTDNTTSSDVATITVTENLETTEVVNKASNNKTKNPEQEEKTTQKTLTSVRLSKIPAYKGKPYVIIKDNKPDFKQSEITKKAFEKYSPLDKLGRCGVAVASVGREIMPTEKRGAIGPVRPTGWHTIKYDFVDGKYLYNRCHLLGYQLTGENANERNLVTGTRYLNVEGMLPFEDMVAAYVKETGNHVMYRVTPIYDGNNLLASGVTMEGYSVEDKGAGVSFNVYCYNAQPGVDINYATGESSLDKKTASNNSETKKGTTNNSKPNSNNTDKKTKEYILNMNTKKFHLPTCYSIKQMSNSNKGIYDGDRQDLIEQGYEPCKICNP